MYRLYEEDCSFNKDYTNGCVTPKLGILSAMQISYKG